MNHKHIKRLICILSLLTGLAYNLSAQHTPRRLNYLDELLGTNVNCILRDHSGLTWIGTDKGVNCYNGKTVTNLLFEDDNNYMVSCICETKAHELLVGTSDGLYRIDIAMLTCRKTYVKEIKHVNAICESGDRLYIASRDGLYICHNNKVEDCVRVEQNVMSQGNIVHDVVADTKTGNVWFCTANALIHYDCKHKSTQRHDLHEWVSHDIARHLALCGNKVYIGTNRHGLLCYDKGTARISKVAEAGNIVNDLQCGQDGKLYISGNGSMVLDTRHDSIIATYNKFDKRKLPSTAVYTFWHDNTLGIDWTGYFLEGMMHDYHERNLFQVYRHKDFNTQDLQVRSFCIHGEDKLIGTREGLYYVNEQRDIIRYFSPAELQADVVTNICYFAGRFVLSTYEQGIRFLDPQTLTLTQPDQHEALQQGHFSRLMITPDSTRLFACCDLGIYVLDPELQLVRWFDHSNSGLPNDYIPDLYFDKGGKGWIGTSNQLCIYDPVMGTIQANGFPEGYFNKVSQLTFGTAFDGDVLAFSGRHIFKSKKDLSEYSTISLTLGKHMGDINFIQPLNDHYWVGTNNGLYVFDKAFHDYVYFNASDNIPSPIFNKQEVQVTPDGTLWMANTGGLIYITSDQQRHIHDSIPGSVILERLLIDDREQPRGHLLQMLYDSEKETPRIRLTWNGVSDKLSFVPLLLDYALPRGRAYEWSLDGGDYQACTDNGIVEIEGLFLGRHTLTIRISGHPETTSTYIISVWPSWVMWMEVAIVILLIVTLFMMRQNSKRRKHKKQLLHRKHALERQLAATNAIQHMEKQHEQETEEKLALMQQRASGKEYRELAHRVKELMEIERPYRKQAYRLTDLAASLKVSPTMLSLMFNQTLQTNFYDYINALRLQEFKRLSADKRNAHLSSTALAEKCGFKKTSFYATFKRIEGCTPSEYLNRLASEASEK